MAELGRGVFASLERADCKPHPHPSLNRREFRRGYYAGVTVAFASRLTALIAREVV